MDAYLRHVNSLARKHPKRILFNEGEDDRILDAIRMIVRRNTAHVTLLGDSRTILPRLRKRKISLSSITFIDVRTIDKQKYADMLFVLRKKRGMTSAKARTLVDDLNYLGCLMVHCGEADGMVSGAIGTTASLLKPALHILRERDRLVSSFFLMSHAGDYLLFADPSVNIEPTPDELATIAIDTARSAQHLFGMRPRIALLSFSTHGSADHPRAKDVERAVRIVRKRAPDLAVDGELQADAALRYDIYLRKCKKPVLKERANVLIYPNLSASNISYKLVQWLGGYEAVGPVLQGLKKPVNDLSRGCTVKDIVDLTALTVCEAQQRTNR